MSVNSRALRIGGWAGIALLAAALVVVLLRADWSGVALLTAFLVASIAFVGFEDRLPPFFDLFFVSAAIVNAGGWVWDLYTRVCGYDEFAHFFTTFAVALSFGYLAFDAMQLHFREHRWHYALAITSFGVTLGAWWEVVEWVILTELTDPVGDIVLDTLGAFLAAGLAVWSLGKEDPEQTGRR